MEKIHSLLKRQLRKHFGDGFAVPAEWEAFVEAVNNAYVDSDTDRAMLERAYDLSSHDLIRANYELRAIFQAIPDLLFRFDSDGKILDCKAGNMTDLFLPPSKMIGKRIQDVRPENVAEKFIKAISEANTTESVVSFDYSLPLAGHELFYEARLIPMPGKNFIAIVRNITTRKLAEKELRKLTLAIEQSPVSVIITDKKGTIEYVNPKFVETSGFAPHEVIGQNPRIFRSGIQPAELYKGLWDMILSGREWHGEMCNKKKNGEIYWEFVSISPIRDDEGEITHFVAIKEDITQRKKAAEELRRAKEAAEVADKTKSSFLATVSHELRTPMNAIIGLAQLLQKAELNAEHRDYVDTIMLSSTSLLKTINDIIDFSKIWSGSLEMEKIDFNLENLINDIASGMMPENRSRDIGVSFSVAGDMPHPLKGSPRRLKQVLHHLVDNALKFTESGEITITASVDRIVQDKIIVRFSVKDTGMGMTLEQASKIFQPFTQADGSITRRFGGTGLGLAISKQLVELMGGTIRVKSMPNEGSEFIFTAEFGMPEDLAMPSEKLPEPLKKTSGAGRSNESVAGIRGSCVLLVEDNEINQEVARAFLESEGILIDIAANGQEALKMVARKRYDAVLMDIWMPDMDGFEATKKIRNLPGLGNLPVIAMTADTMGGNLSNLYAAGMNDCIFKPIDGRKLRSVLSRWIKSKTGTTIDSSKDAGAAGPPNSRPVDFGTALSRVGNDRQLYIKLLTRFCKDNEKSIDAIKDALDKNDFESAGRLAHSLKGVAGNIGADDLMAAVRDMEFTIKNADRTSIDAHLAATSNSLNAAINAIREYIASTDKETSAQPAGMQGNSQSVPEKIEIWPALNNLKEHLEEYSVESALIFEDVKKLLRPYGIAMELKQLESAIVKYDFELANRKLTDIYGFLHIPQKGRLNG